MSKSLGNTIGIFEAEAVIKQQIMGCFTDPHRLKATDPGKVEGNPVFLYHDLINDDPVEVADLKQRYAAGTVGDVEVKQKLLAAHARLFGAARQRRVELAAHPEDVQRILATGAARASQVAQETLARVYQTIGITN
jgi:tryptophanyl-tRNA synthetase